MKLMKSRVLSSYWICLSVYFCFLAVAQGQGVHAQGTQTPHIQTIPTAMVRFSEDLTLAQANQKLSEIHMMATYKSYLVPGLFIAKPSNPKFVGAEAMRQATYIPQLVYFEPDGRTFEQSKKFIRTALHIPDLESYLAKSFSQARTQQQFPQEPDISKQWAFFSPFGVNANEAWTITRGHPSIVIAVVDEGQIFEHPDRPRFLLGGYDFVNNREPAYPGDRGGFYHGTAVASLIAGPWNRVGIAGIAPDSTILPIKVLPGDGGDETDENVLRAFEYAIAKGARIINCSFGKAIQSRAIYEAIEGAGRRGVLFVAAAGNGAGDYKGDDLNLSPYFPAKFHNENMIVVGATDFSGQLGSFSNYGMGIVDVGAPGVYNYVAYTLKQDALFTWAEGTSFAAPLVSGAAALMLSVNPRLSAYQIKSIIMNTVKPSIHLKGRVISGGVLDISKAVKTAASTQQVPR